MIDSYLPQPLEQIGQVVAPYPQWVRHGSQFQKQVEERLRSLYRGSGRALYISTTVVTEGVMIAWGPTAQLSIPRLTEDQYFWDQGLSHIIRKVVL